MKETLGHLVELQRTDDRLATLRRRLDSIPEELAERESQQSALEAELDALEAERKSSLVRAQDLENAVRQREERIAKLEEKTRNLKDAGAVKVAEHEINDLRQKISQDEENALKLLEQAERLASDREGRKGGVAESAGELDLFRETVAQDRAELEAEIEGALEVRASHLAEVPAAVRDLYEKLLPVRKGRAAVPMKGESCGGCGMVVPPNERLKVLAMSSLIRCKSCTRILIFHEIWSPETAQTESD